MSRSHFQRLAHDRPLLLDGATGTELFKRGLPAGAPPEQWVLENPEVIQQLHREYYEAGSDIVLACTFGANRLKLADHGLDGRVREMNARLVEISRQVVPAGRMLFGDLSPTGQLEPFGTVMFEEAVAVFREQAKALADAGADGFMIETMMDIQEARAALIGVREISPDLPVICGMTYDGSGRTLSGTPPAAALVTLQALGADAVGCNCSTGPAEMLALLEQMLPYARVPLFIKPNAGMPCFRDGHNHYDMPAEEFAEAVVRGVRMGARIAGGCCGTTPDHIRATRQAIEAAGSLPARAPSDRVMVGSHRTVVDFSDTEGRAAPLRIIGERINPTGKKAFQAELLAGDLGRIYDFADEQTEAGADLLDVNLGLGGVDEASLMQQAVKLLTAAASLPLVIDTVNPEAMEMALRLYPGRALVNSVSGEQSRLEGILPLAARYGAAVIALPVGDGFIPETPAERMNIVRQILAAAEPLGIGRNDILVDGLAMTVSAGQDAGRAALETIRLCSEEGLFSVLGLSNVSFGMPERPWLNAMFLGMGMAAGLRAVIANPSAPMLMQAKYAADALLGRSGGTIAYAERYSAAAKEEPPRPFDAGGAPSAEPAALAADAVLKGNIKQAASLAREAMTAGLRAGELVAGHLVPAIMRAGELFESGKYYLPQLMLSGEAMRLALDELEPDLAGERLEGVPSESRGKVIMATVKGDVHDIGKNLVCLMLRNHGFEVVDLGKDVSSEQILQAIGEHQPDIIGLSALMTTTLASMRQTIAAVRQAGHAVRFMVGGAAVTSHFAAEAGADGYSADAVSAVKLAGELMEEKI